MTTSVIDALIIGSGMAGLMAARRLADAGLRALILEQNAVVGGRLATQQVGKGAADYGAQFFTARSAEFSAAVDHWLGEGMVYEWSRGWSDGSLLPAPPDGFPRYAARDGFGAFASRLAEGLDVRASTRLESLSPNNDGWVATCVDGAAFYGRSVILTPPAPQSLALLDAGEVVLPADEREALESIRYAPCLCGLIAIEGEVELPPPGAFQQPHKALSWIADNQRKGISPDERILTVHAGPAASRGRWQTADRDILAWMLRALSTPFPPVARAREARLKRWRYAVPVTIHPARYLLSRLPAPLVFAGDAFGGPRVEGAALSGWAAAEALIDIL